jgi:NAD(P)-dependent dehydrogenase (short-subunit alcohol dehydrogenase family)
MREQPIGDLSDNDLITCARVLRALTHRPELCDGGGPRCSEVFDLAGRLLRARRDQLKRAGRERDREVLDGAAIRARRAPAALPGPAAAPVLPALSAPRNCYICKRSYDRRHPFYDSLCPACGDLNFAKRHQTANLDGKVALVTGARIKIGQQIALKLLRAGSSVVATTRFPHDAARRYAAEPDFSSWADRLRIHAIDLRHLPAVELFAAELCRNLDRLDVVINNAAQAIHRPPAFYRHLLDGERAGALPPAAQRLLGPALAPAQPTIWGPLPALLSQLPLLPGDEGPQSDHFPPGKYDADGQQIDLRDRNSWGLELGEVEVGELLEVHAVNSFAPFLLLRGLEPLLLRHPGQAKYVVNVSAMEGHFNGPSKTGRHPHTNMAKAALNMLTRTSAGPYAERGIYMNSVDTGWVSNQAAHPKAERMAGEGFREPLDALDGAARVLDPVFVGVNTGQNEFGKLWKDYRPIAW